MKLSELTYDYLLSVGLGRVHMHTDCSDELRVINCQLAFDDAKKRLFDKYGDVSIIINPKAHWFDRIKIEDEKWQADHEEFDRRKQEWCNKYGCD